MKIVKIVFFLGTFVLSACSLKFIPYSVYKSRLVEGEIQIVKGEKYFVLSDNSLSELNEKSRIFYKILTVVRKNENGYLKININDNLKKLKGDLNALDINNDGNYVPVLVLKKN